MNYRCEICGQSHEYYFGIKAGVSQTLSQIKKENSKRVFEPEKDYFLVDKSIAVFPAIIELKTNYDNPFWYETWVECNGNTFINMSENYKNEIGADIKGKLYENLIPYYENTKGLNCTIKFSPNMRDKDRARINILDDSKLKSDQMNGLTNERLIELMNKIHHKNED